MTVDGERRGRGRPRLPVDRRLVHLYVGVSGQAHGVLQEEANARGVALADVLRDAVTEWIAQRREVEGGGVAV